MNTLSSRDGTTIAYDEQGEGPALILVDGALTVHSSGSGSELAKLLAPHFTVFGFDRRGRGESGDTLPYAVDREIDDIEALIDRAGGPAFLYGHSSGGPLAMRAAIRLGRKVSKIALYEPPYNNDPGVQESWSQYLRQLKQALAERRRPNPKPQTPNPKPQTPNPIQPRANDQITPFIKGRAFITYLHFGNIFCGLDLQLFSLRGSTGKFEVLLVGHLERKITRLSSLSSLDLGKVREIC